MKQASPIGQRFRYALVLLTVVVAAGLSSSTRGQEDGGAIEPGPAEQVDLSIEQAGLADRFERLQLIAARLAELSASSDPHRAELLREALAGAREAELDLRFESVVTLLEQERYSAATKNQQVLKAELLKLLDLLLKENRADEIRSEQEWIRAQLKEVNRIIRLQRGVKARTEGGDDTDRLAGDQGKISDRTQDLSDKIDEVEGRDGEGEDAGEGDGEKSEQGDSRENAESSSDNEQPSDASGDSPQNGNNSGESEQQGEPGGDGEQGGSESQQSQNGSESNGDDSQGDKPSENGDDPKDGDSDADESQQDESESSDPSDQSSDGSPSDSSGKPNPSQGQPSQGQGQPGGGDSDSSEQQPQPSSPQEEIQRRLNIAQKSMQQAQQKLEEAKRKGATEDQEAALRELEEAKAELERILRQLREEEKERTLALLEARFRRMLELQLEVYEGTLRVARVPKASRDHGDEIEAGRLSRQEAVIVKEADRALEILLAEGTSVAFPEATEQLRQDMQDVTERLAKVQVDEITQMIEEDIIAQLEEAIEAFQKSLEEMEQNKTPPGESPPPGEPQEPPLVDLLEEVKMIRALQMRVNRRTLRYAEMVGGDQAEAPQILQALDQLAERQDRIYRATRDLHLEKNK